MRIFYKILLVLIFFTFISSKATASKDFTKSEEVLPIGSVIAHNTVSYSVQDTTDSKPTTSSTIDPQDYEHDMPVIYKIAYIVLFIILMTVSVWLIRKFWFNLKRNKVD